MNDEILGVRELHLLPLDHLTAENYTAVLTNDTFQLYFINSTIIVVAVTLLTLGVGIPATCSVNRFKYPGHKYTVLGLISSQTLPLVLVFITFFTVMFRLGQVDTHIRLVFAPSTGVLPFAV